MPSPSVRLRTQLELGGCRTDPVRRAEIASDAAIRGQADSWSRRSAHSVQPLQEEIVRCKLLSGRRTLCVGTGVNECDHSSRCSAVAASDDDEACEQARWSAECRPESSNVAVRGAVIKVNVRPKDHCHPAAVPGADALEARGLTCPSLG